MTWAQEGSSHVGRAASSRDAPPLDCTHKTSILLASLLLLSVLTSVTVLVVLIINELQGSDVDCSDVKALKSACLYRLPPKLRVKD